MKYEKDLPVIKYHYLKRFDNKKQGDHVVQAWNILQFSLKCITKEEENKM